MHFITFFFVIFDYYCCCCYCCGATSNCIVWQYLCFVVAIVIVIVLVVIVAMLTNIVTTNTTTTISITTTRVGVMLFKHLDSQMWKKYSTNNYNNSTKLSRSSNSTSKYSTKWQLNNNMKIQMAPLVTSVWAQNNNNDQTP